MPKPEELKQITTVAEKLAEYYTFPGFDVDDIKQEALLVGISVFDKFDSTTGKLEDFLFITIKNALLNLKIKHYYNPRSKTDYSKLRKSCIRSCQIMDEHEYVHPFEDLETKEIVELIDRYIHPHLKKDYMKIREGMSVGKLRRDKILTEVKRIHKLIMEDRVDDLEKQLQSR
jgi:hypothetical protein